MGEAGSQDPKSHHSCCHSDMSVLWTRRAPPDRRAQDPMMSTMGEVLQPSKDSNSQMILGEITCLFYYST